MSSQAIRLSEREVVNEYLPEKKLCTSRAFKHLRINKIAQTLWWKVRRWLKNKDKEWFSMNLTEKTQYGRYIFWIRANILEMFNPNIDLNATWPLGSVFQWFLTPISELGKTDEYIEAIQKWYCYHRNALEEWYQGQSRSLDNIRTFVWVKLLKGHLEKWTSLGKAIDVVDERIKEVVSLLEGWDFEKANNVFGKILEACRSIEVTLDKR